MKMFTRIVVVVCVSVSGLTLSPRIASAQADTTDAVLRVPAGAQLRCRAISPSSADAARGAHTHLQIEEVRPLGTGTREDDIWYDSTGKGLWITEVVTTVNSDGGANLDAITAVRAPDGQFAGFRRRYNGAAVGAKNPVLSRQTTSLNKQQVSAAQKLTRWFWTRRCSPVSASPGGHR